ncbi:mediator of RNA polymerase II transcription subunit 1-domain-containing protein [Xylariaceae sp. FL0594]|nr:mediator of RNA polymerase II transcription subunit 1-domain-containing protein [Xylariaceae sp. FL0594]
MSTPMRHGPSQQGRTPSQHPAAMHTPQASTPFSTSQAAAAPTPHGPRSSPQQFKRSPAAGTLASTLNFDSPSAAAALGGLGLGDLGLDNISVGGLAAPPARSDEDEKKKRLDAVIAALSSFDAGLVSNDGLERVARQLGLEFIWESDPSGLHTDKVLIIAGETMGVEVDITNHIVSRASLTFNEPSPSLDRHVEKASAILLKNLALGPGESQLTKKVASFKANLARLATLDKLSVTPGLNCHEAIAGMWDSLERLHRWDVERLREDADNAAKSEENLRLLALCQRHGCPLMHARGRIGLTLDYWKQYRAYRSTTVEAEDEDGKTWSILIDCAPSGGMVCNPVRVSDQWIAPGITKENPTDGEALSSTGPVLDWLEPPNTLLPSGDEPKVEGGSEAAMSHPGFKSPGVIFMATFDPPLVVTHGVALEISKMFATDQPLASSTFDALLFPIPPSANYDPSDPRELSYTQIVPTFPNPASGQSDAIMKYHQNTLLVDKPVYGQVLRQVPFTHPKELVAILPTLRQYAFLSTLLDTGFKPREDLSSIREANEPSAEKLKVDIVLSAHPVPRLQLVFPFRDMTAMIHLEIQLNGKVHIISDNIFSETGSATRDNGKGKLLSRKQMAEKLELCENLGHWIEFIHLHLD